MRFLVEPQLLDHFGVAMYNTLEKSIAELVANGYDADASKVRVTVRRDEIIVADDGRGMTPDEVQDDYLRLGRDRRTDEDRELTRRQNDPSSAIRASASWRGSG